MIAQIPFYFFKEVGDIYNMIKATMISIGVISLLAAIIGYIFNISILLSIGYVFGLIYICIMFLVLVIAIIFNLFLTIFNSIYDNQDEDK